MAITTQLPAPVESAVVDGHFTLSQLFVNGTAAAAPVSPTEIHGIQDISAEPITFLDSAEHFQQGAGYDALTINRGQRAKITFTISAGRMNTFLAAVNGIAHSAAGEAALITNPSQYPLITIEMAARQNDNNTHLYSVVYQDLILEPWSIGSPMGMNDSTVSFTTKHDPFVLASGTQLVYDTFAGDASAVAFTPSSTPLTLTDITDADQPRGDWVLDEFVYIKIKESGDIVGTRQKSGVSFASAVTFTTAPAASSLVEIMYAKATA